MSRVLVKRPRTRLARTQKLVERILVALDGSEPADKALDFALDLATHYSANIVLLNVVPPVTVPIVPFSATGMQSIRLEAMGTYSKELKAHHKRVLSEALKKAKKAKPNLKISTKLVEGRPSDKIVETARKGRFNLIVMGSRGLGGIKEFFLGSVSDRVADEATCPVLIVK